MPFNLQVLLCDLPAGVGLFRAVSVKVDIPHHSILQNTENHNSSRACLDAMSRLAPRSHGIWWFVLVTAYGHVVGRHTFLTAGQTGALHYTLAHTRKRPQTQKHMQENTHIHIQEHTEEHAEELREEETTTFTHR